MSSSELFAPFKLGSLTLSNRMVMAPMTRNRADRNGVPTRQMADYYQQRASAGLIITESAPVSAQAVGYPFTPGLFADEQAAGWLRVTDAVHSAGGRIFAQLQHCGRISHPELQPSQILPVSSFATRPDGQAITYSGLRDFVTPRALETGEIEDLVMQFQHGAMMAKFAGFDGVEVHGANGYIVDQFLRDGVNRRTDIYGGSVQNRMRLLNEILDAVTGIWPAERVGVRLTPENSFNSMSDSNPQGHFSYFVEQLSVRGLAYVHILEGDMMSKARAVDYRALRRCFEGPYLASNGYDRARAQQALGERCVDLVAFGVPFLANPDLVRRFRDGLPLNAADPATFYSGGEAGYIDYPSFRSEYLAA